MRFLLLVVLGLFLSGCVTTQELPLAQNMVRIDTHASGLAFVGSATQNTMMKAAKATLRHGYTHFRLQNAALGQGRQVAGITGHRVGNGGFYASPVLAPTADVGVTVIMYHAKDAGAKGAFNAREVLAKGGKV